MPQKTLFFLLAFCTLSNFAVAQVNVIPNVSALNITQKLSGNGVFVSNLSIQCANDGWGVFDTSYNAAFSFNSGIILTNGNVQSLQFSSVTFASTSQNYTGDTLLTIQADSFDQTTAIPVSEDACAIEFEVISTSDTISLDYIFGSEEYTSYVCTGFNDAVGIFISGLNPLGGQYSNQNFAIVPGTSYPVSVNTINGGNSSGTATCLTGNTVFYSALSGIVYDGRTVPLTALVPVIPLQTYHVRIVVADMGNSPNGDDILDSGVFLKANSLSGIHSLPYLPQLVTVTKRNAYEGCLKGRFNFSIPYPLTEPVVLRFIVSGSATLNSDYSQFADSVLIAAGDTTAFIEIDAFDDNDPELPESITLMLITDFGFVYDTVELYLYDSPPVSVYFNDTSMCSASPFIISSNIGYDLVLLNLHNDTMTLGNSSGIVVTQDTSLIVLSHIGVCTFSDTFIINAFSPDFSIETSDDSACTGQWYTLLCDVLGPDTGYLYSWASNQSILQSEVQKKNPHVLFSSSPSVYHLAVTSPSGCIIADSVTVTAATSFPLQITVSEDTVCQGQPVTISAISEFNSAGSICYRLSSGCSGLISQDTLASNQYIQTGSPTANISLYGNYLQSTRIQMLYKANELKTALGTDPVVINAIAWKIGVFNSSAMLKNYTISLSCLDTTVSTLSGWYSSPQVVYGPKNFYPSQIPDKWQWHTLDNPYLWDGSSNLLVEVCIYNPATSGNFNNMMVYMPSDSSVVYNTSNLNLCTVSSQPMFSNQLPVIGFRHCKAPFLPGYYWNGNNISDAFVGLTEAYPDSSGWYHLYASLGSCAASDSVHLTILPVTPFSLSASTPICHGQNNGELTIDYDPSTGATHQWSNGNTSATISNLGEGLYYVTVTEQNGCEVSDTIALNEPELLQLSETISHPSSSASGYIAVSVTGGIPPFLFNWSNGQTSNFISNLAAGIYIVTVTDSLGCSVSKTYTLLPLSVPEDEEATIYINPNPASSILHIGWIPAERPHLMRLIDLNGRVMLETPILEGQQSSTINAESFANGLYIVAIYSKNITTHQPIVIQHNP